MPTYPTATLAETVTSHLLVVDDAGSRRIPLPHVGALVIGRSSDCDVQLADNSASRAHARLEVLADGLVLHDLDSRHGTRCDGRLVDAAVRVETGAVIELGRSTLVVHARMPAAVIPADTRTRAPEPMTVDGRALIAADPAMTTTYELVRRLASGALSILVVGETGAGKEMIAHAVHAWSPRATSGRLVAVNCAALPETLIESELFGHEKGAFSGADRAKPGLIELAAGGTLFLDELVELPPAAQAKLLRALEQRAIVRVGGLESIPVDFRIVAATNRNVADEIASGRLRADLYYRVAGAVIELPPLRDRPRDLVALALAFTQGAATRLGRSGMRLTDDALRALLQYQFPGNVRELANAIEYAVTTAVADEVDAASLPPSIRVALPAASAGGAPSVLTGFRPIDDEVAELERRRMEEALISAEGNQSRAADMIGMPRRTFVKKLARYGLRRSGSKH